MSNKIVTKNSFPWVWVFTFILAVLKLTGVANITWLVVFAPFWILLLILIGVFIIMVIAAVVIGVIEGLQKK